jgi:hypothetical protein
MHAILPPPPDDDDDWDRMHTTELVVPRSIPATVARPRKPIRAMTTKVSTTAHETVGRRASMPPDLPSSVCLLVILDFLFLPMIVLCVDDAIVVAAGEPPSASTTMGAGHHSPDGPIIIRRSRFVRRSPSRGAGVVNDGIE